jgi:hypothetical protein
MCAISTNLSTITRSEEMKNGGCGSRREPRVIKQPIASRVLDLPRAAEYVGLTPTALAGMVHRGALPVIRYPGLRPWAGAGSKMYFDVLDLDQFVEINKEYGYEELDGKKRINVRNSDDVTELLRRNYISEGGRTKAQLIPELPSTMEDLLNLALRSKSMQGFTEAVSQPEYPGFRGVSSNTCLQIFLIGWYARNAVTPEVLNELDALIRALQPTMPESPDSVMGSATASAATAKS